MPTPPEFSSRLLAWFDQHGRHDLPWQHPRTPYRVWLSEVMLQQTQVATVIPYFERFLQHFPNLPALAAADEDAVFAQWAGLGYYSRARNLHRAAQQCVVAHGGDIPRDRAALEALPGIGRSTAAAILTQAFGEREAILDGNVKRVLCRVLGEAGDPSTPAVERRLWAEAEARLPTTRLADYTQALMDLGATVCTRSKPRCASCPLRDDCVAFRDALQPQLPARAARKALPLRHTHLAVLRDSNNRVLLEKRSAAGVWKGLWSLPEAPTPEAPLVVPVSLPKVAGEPITGFLHTFSHYRLQASATLYRVADAAPVALPYRWQPLQDLHRIGLPKPIRTLLESL